MSSVLVGRRNRFKKPKSRSLPAWRRLPALIDWAALARRGALVALVAASLAGLTWALNRPVSSVAIDGSFQRVSPVEIEKAVAPYLSAGFMSVDLDAVRRAVQQIPWVDQARVQRRWPTSLHISVVEQTAAARWNGSGLLNTRGELFIQSAAYVPPELPALSGPAGTEGQVAKLYLDAEPRLVEAGLRIAALKLDERGAWEMDLSNGLAVRLGRNHVEQRVGRFIRTAAGIIAHRLSEVAYVDMRYANGFAVGWRTAAMPAAQPP
ncbi:MAG: cell division protein FtsQ/DivIB, partial [Gammaproteobacteria bacterium]|nr:cell division protein FtsQ/DivIB [Gammaproteobacteria bacterium]